MADSGKDEGLNVSTGGGGQTLPRARSQPIGSISGIMRPCLRVVIAPHVWAAMALATGLLLSFRYYSEAPRWTKNFGLCDSRYFFGPNAFFLDVSLKNGEFPLWNPLSYCGTPFSADPQSNACYPFHLLRSLVTPACDPYATAVSIEILLLLHLLLGGLGVFCLTRDYGVSFWAGLAGAFVFTLSPFSIINSIEFYVFPLVTSWAPWLVWLARRAFRSPRVSGWLFYTASAALFMGISTLGGFPQLTLYMGLTLAVFALLDGVLHVEWRGLSQLPRQILPIIAARGLFLVLAAVFGALVAALLLVPAYEFGQYSLRVPSAGLAIGSWSQNIEWSHLLKCLVVFPGNTWLPQGCRAAGIGSLLALLAALLGRRDRRDALVFAGAYLLLTDCTLGPAFPVGALLDSLDFLNIIVSPWRAGIFSSFALAAVVAFGVDAAGRASHVRWGAVGRSIVLLAAGAGMLLLLGQWLRDKPLYVPGTLVWLLPALTLLAMLVFAWIRMPRLGAALIAALVVGEILAWTVQMVPEYVSKRLASGRTDRFGTVTQISQDNRRTAVARANWHMWTLDMAAYGYGPLYVGCTRQVLCKPSREKDYYIGVKPDEVFIENQRGHLFLKRGFWLARQWVSGPLPGKGEVFPAATTVFLPDMPAGTALSVPQVRRELLPNSAASERVERVDLGAGPSLRGMMRKSGRTDMALALPAFEQGFVHSVLCVGYTASTAVDFYPVCVDENGTVRSLKRSRATPTKGQMRVVEFPLPDCRTNKITLKWPQNVNSGAHIEQIFVKKDMEDENPHIVIERRRANSVELMLNDLPGNRILTFVDSAYPGWRAWVDDHEVPIWRANDAFKAVAVPAGTHHVCFTFQPWTTYAGLAVSSVTVLFLLAVIAGTAVVGRTRRTACPRVSTWRPLDNR